MKRKFLLVAIAGAFAINASGQWSARQNMPVTANNAGISGVQCFSLNGKVYAGGGYYAMFSNTNHFHVYDPSTNQWTQKAAIPGGTSRSAGIAFTYNGKGYVGLGAQDWSSLNTTLLSDLWMYDPSTDQWTQKASLPDTGRSEAGCFMVNDKIYVVGGVVTQTGYSTKDVWEYDPATDQWTAKNQYPLGAISSPFAWGSATKGYISAGYAGYYSRKTYEYTPGNDSWALRDSFPGTGGNDGITFVLNNKAYCGLTRDGSTYATNFYAYDMATNTWGPAIAFPHGGRANAMAATVNNKAYVGTGWKPASSTTYFKDWYEYPSTVGIEAFAEQPDDLVAYPNPAHGSFSIFTDKDVQYEIYSLTGQKLKSGRLAAHDRIETGEFATGVYVVKVIGAGEVKAQMLKISN
jgi:N-acetylneuraminic acid mutarotase